MEFENQDIKCSIFRDTETVLKKITAKIEESNNAKERQYYAQDILLELETLLSCSNYEARNYGCIRCRSILHNYLKKYETLSKVKEAKW